MAAKYSKVERKVHRDEKVRTLSKPPPNGRDMWWYLLTCDSQTAFPGLFVLKLPAAADDLEWPLEDTRRVLQEVVDTGMAMFDPVTSVVWLPKAVGKRGDEALSRNTAKGWRNAWDEMPACDLTRHAWRAALEAIQAAAEDSESDPEPAVRAFSARPPSWLNEPPPPPKPLRSPLEAPSKQKKQEQEDQSKSTPTDRAGARDPSVGRSDEFVEIIVRELAELDAASVNLLARQLAKKTDDLEVVREAAMQVAETKVVRNPCALVHEKVALLLQSGALEAALDKRSPDRVSKRKLAADMARADAERAAQDAQTESNRREAEADYEANRREGEDPVSYRRRKASKSFPEPPPFSRVLDLAKTGT
jgi:hypothetical protein